MQTTVIPGFPRSTTDAPRYAEAQLSHLRRQIPPLYALLAVNAAALAFTHRHLAPALLTLQVPAVLIAACLARMLVWALPTKRPVAGPVDAVARLRRITPLALAMAVSFVTWALVLDRYGGPYEHGHVAIFISITVLGCVFCLGYLPRAALMVCTSVVGIFLAYNLWKGTEVLIAVAFNVALVTAVILKVLRDSFDGFLQLQASQEALQSERTAAERLNDENARLARTDALTQLPNRRLFMAELEQRLAQADAIERVSVGLLDLDGFKPINDTYGHGQGDRLLTALGERLRAVASDRVMVARLGGDEFGVIVRGDAYAAAAEGERLCDLLRQPVVLGEVTVAVGCSAGFATFPDAGRSAHELFDRADFALYHAKANQRGGCVIFSPRLEQLVRGEQALEAALQSAPLEQEFSVVFQPVFDTATLEIVGVEALARWESPTLGKVAPDQFFPVAERLGITRPLTLALFGKVLAAGAELPRSMRISFNLSPVDLVDRTTIDLMLERLEESAVDPRRLVFELTENALVTDLTAAVEAMHRLKAIGIRLALDDFGTGYSSLSSLHQMPFDILKVDRSFAARLSDHVGRRLVAAIRGVGRSLSMRCVMEGIETETQLIEARLSGFELAQGYHLSRPMTLEDLTQMVRARQAAA
ncbi:putative bifunctional diguanylate cyclase/phosphodiesterase [Sphingomonas adhaesiva]|uniref:putative bifunctional diguanylate cyclase/phosphodiesterase n=1 Tax=Sphingomonas adhaesiva TaxID=28212 RepID=UPI002FF47C81